MFCVLLKLLKGNQHTLECFDIFGTKMIEHMCADWYIYCTHSETGCICPCVCMVTIVIIIIFIFFYFLLLYM